MIFEGVASILISQDKSFGYIKRFVARVLLENAGDGKNERRWLTQRDIATITGTNLEMVHVCLKSLRDEGSIRIEHNRITINKELLHKKAGVILSKGVLYGDIDEIWKG